MLRFKAMEHRHYEVIADWVKTQDKDVQLSLCIYFNRHCYNFKEYRFLTACGWTKKDIQSIKPNTFY